MSNYRITIEQIDDKAGLPEGLRKPIECAGFSMILMDDEHKLDSVAVVHMTTLQVAEAIAETNNLYAASKIADGLRQAQEIERKGSMDSILRKLRDIANNAPEKG